MIKFNSILKFIIHLSTIYINPMITEYFMKVVWEFGVETRLRSRQLNVAGLPKV